MKTILICEDNKLAARTLVAVLSRSGIISEIASDGNEAMEMIGSKRFDLIIADIHLPYHSGLELVGYIRGVLKLKTPVIVISAFSDRQIKKQAMELGANDYVIKPVDPADIISRVEALLTP